MKKIVPEIVHIFNQHSNNLIIIKQGKWHFSACNFWTGSDSVMWLIVASRLHVIVD